MGCREGSILCCNSEIESYFEMSSKNNRGLSSLTDIQRLKLFYVPYQKIINCKFSIYEKFLLENDLDEGKYDQIENDNACNLSKQVIKFRNFINEFVEIAFIQRNNIKSKFALNEVFNFNNREIVKFYSVVAREILYFIPFSIVKHSSSEEPIEKLHYLMDNEDERFSFCNKYHYLIYNALMLNQTYFSLGQYAYKLTEVGHHGNKIKTTYRASKKVESDKYSLIPNLLHFNRYIDNEMLEEENKWVPFLIKVRILQYLEYNGTATFKQLSAKLSRAFNYQIDMIETEAHMLYAEQCISRYTRGEEQNFRDSENGRGYFCITKIGKLLLTNFIYKYEYLFHVVDSTYIENEFCKEFFFETEPLLHRYEAWALELESGTKQSSKIRQIKFEIGTQIGHKILHLYLLINFLWYVEKKQAIVFKKNTGNKYFAFEKIADKDNLFVSPQMLKGILPTIELSFRSYGAIMNSARKNIEEIVY